MASRILFLLLCLSSLFSYAAPVYISLGTDAANQIQSFSRGALNVIKANQEVTVLKVQESELEKLSHFMHDEFHRCGGYFIHDSRAEALELVEVHGFSGGGKKEKRTARHNYTIDQMAKVSSAINEAQELPIRNVIKKLSSYPTRHYQSKSGVASSRWIASYWKKLAAHRSDVKVQLVKHKWAQESVIMTIAGSTNPKEIVVIGGHADSINQRGKLAPGADDNASGIATITEIIRVAMKTSYKPRRTVQFMAYAAEEVGLRGSSAIAGSYKSNNAKVIGALQLDMTGHKGTRTKDIVMMSDYTNKYQNQFIGALIDRYTGYAWGYSKCGYGCSDHASWHRNGYSASIPFESTMNDINNKIHSTQDTLENLGGNADHALKFAQLGVAFMIELAK